MKTLPILFSGPMIRAILEGRKTQTRRIVKPQPEHLQIHTWKGKTLYDGEARVWCWREHLWFDATVDCRGTDTVSPLLLPHSPVKVGDVLWVKETHQILFTAPERTGHENWKTGVGLRAVYTATDGRVEYHDEEKGIRDTLRPSIFMPRWASRINLRVTGVRAERVQAISEADIAAEGVTVDAAHDLFFEKRPLGVTVPLGPWSPCDAWRIGWSAINGAESWASNPWVQVYEFERTQ